MTKKEKVIRKNVITKSQRKNSKKVKASNFAPKYDEITGMKPIKIWDLYSR